jgi:NADPH-dependent curcumin reductase CurA
VGGPILDTMLGRMRVFSRVVVCGLISEYNATEPYGYKRLRSVLVNRIKMQGMIVFDWQARYGEGIKGLAGHLRRGQAQVSRVRRRGNRQLRRRPSSACSRARTSASSS